MERQRSREGVTLGAGWRHTQRAIVGGEFKFFKYHLIRVGLERGRGVGSFAEDQRGCGWIAWDWGAGGEEAFGPDVGLEFPVDEGAALDWSAEGHLAIVESRSKSGAGVGGPCTGPGQCVGNDMWGSLAGRRLGRNEGGHVEERCLHSVSAIIEDEGIGRCWRWRGWSGLGWCHGEGGGIGEIRSEMGPGPDVVATMEVT